MTTETEPKRTTYCRGCDLAFCDRHKHFMNNLTTHGSHHAVELDSVVGCCVCLGILKVDELLQLGVRVEHP